MDSTMTGEAFKQIVDLLQPVAALADGTPFEHSEVIQRCVDASEIALEALARPTSGDYALGYAEGFNDACNPAQQCLDCGSNNIGIPATYASLINSVKTSQENT